MELKNTRHERFCQEYLVDLNATQAYIRVGYKAKSAASMASRLLTNDKVRARIGELMANLSLRTGVNQDRVVRELARVGFLDPTKLIDTKSATVRADATDDDLAAIASIKVKNGSDWTEREIKVADKLKALELLGRHLGMFTDKIDLTTDITLDFSGGTEPPVRIIERTKQSDGE